MPKVFSRATDRKTIRVIGVVRRIRSEGSTKTGGFDRLVSDLVGQHSQISVIELQLSGPLFVSVMHVASSPSGGIRSSRTNIVRLRSGGEILSLALSQVVLLFYVLYARLWYRRKIVVLSADSGSALLMHVLRRIRIVTGWLQHFPDYSPTDGRFSRAILRAIFARFVRSAWLNADFVTTPTPRISGAFEASFGSRMRSTELISNCALKSAVKAQRQGIHSPIRVIFAASTIDPKFDFESAIEGINDLAGATLTILGQAVDVAYLQSLQDLAAAVGVAERIWFTGLLEEDIATQIIQDSDVGIALYRRHLTPGHAEFGDSLKVRDYVAYGLLTVSSAWVWPTPSLSEVGGCISVEDNALWAKYTAAALVQPERSTQIRRAADNWSASEVRLRNLNVARVKDWLYSMPA